MEEDLDMKRWRRENYKNITETFPYLFGNFRKLSIYNCFYAHLTY